MDGEKAAPLQAFQIEVAGVVPASDDGRQH